MKQFSDYEIQEFEFEGRHAIVVLADLENRTDKWLLKTEYFGAFPAFELEMLAEGYNMAHVDNETRWCLPSDTERQAAFCHYLHERFGFRSQCVPVGMSCGGMQAIYLAATHPEVVAAMFLDSPVINFLSCPAGLGIGEPLSMDEFTGATGITLSALLSYRNHPQDRFDDLPRDLPILMACGDADTVVPYEENGALLVAYAKANNLPLELYMKPGVGHHPHCLPDNAPIRAFVKRYY